MVKFFAKLSALLVFAAGVVVWQWLEVEREIESLGEPKGNIDLVAKSISVLKAVPDPKVIFAGDSKAERHFVPHVFLDAGIPAVNLGYFSMDLWAIVNTMEKIGLNRSPAVFVISVGAYQVNDGNNEIGRFTADLFFNFTPWERLRMFRSGYFAAAKSALKYANSYRRFDALVSEARAMAPGDPWIGFVGVEGNEFSCVKFRHNSGVSPYSVYRNIDINGGRWRLFQEAVKKLAGWPGRFILFTGPDSDKGKQCMAGSYPEKMEREFLRKVADLIAPLSNVKLMDLNSRPDLGLTDSDYYDPGHLNKGGAEKFTRWWLSFLRQPN